MVSWHSGWPCGSFRDGTRVAATDPDLVRAICEPNAAALLEVLDETLTVLNAARDRLAEDGSLADLTEAGHDGRQRYETTGRWGSPISGPGIRTGWSGCGRPGSVVV